MCDVEQSFDVACRARRTLKRAFNRAIAELQNAGIELDAQLMPVPHDGSVTKASIPLCI